jgi:hypothetical protein
LLLEDHKLARSEICNDPCVGTGSLLQAQSNYRLCGVGQDIDELPLKCALVQFYLYAPWFAIPIWWLGWSDLFLGNSLSNEKPISLNARYWYQEWFRNNTLDLVSYTIAPSELTEVEQNINISVEPSENAEVSSKSHFVNPKVPAIKQLSLFDL